MHLQVKMQMQMSKMEILLFRQLFRQVASGEEATRDKKAIAEAKLLASERARADRVDANQKANVEACSKNKH